MSDQVIDVKAPYSSLIGGGLCVSSRGDPYQSVEAGAMTLVVEDDARSRFALTVLLKRARLNVVAATNGEAALQTLKHRRQIRLVLMDIMMPIMDGYTTMSAIRKLPEWKNVPIIAVTAKSSDGECERCLAAGASDYIPKPVNAAELMTAMSRWLPAAPTAM